MRKAIITNRGRLPVYLGALILSASCPVGAQPPPQGPDDPAMQDDRRPPPGDGPHGPRRPRRWGEGPGRPERPTPWSELPEQEQRKIERFLEENMPQVYLRTQKLKDNEPQNYDRRMSRMAPEIRRMMEVLRDDPERGNLLVKEKRLQFQMRDLADDYHKATDDAARQDIKTKLRKLTAEAFDYQNQRREQELRALEAKVTNLKERLEESRRMKESLVDRRVEELLKAPGARPKRPRPGRELDE